jgi:hypothetical protein
MTAATAPVRHHTAHDQDPRKRWIIYLTATVIVVIVLVIMVVAYRGHKNTQAAQAKAAQLVSAFTRAGLPAPDTDDIARTLGTDGGAVCTTSRSDLGQAALKLGLINGASGPGIRPVTVARSVLQGERLIVRTYCPQNLTRFDKLIDSLKYAGVIKD